MDARVAIVLAAGKGTRMRSELPKVLHVFAGRPLVAWPLAAAIAVGADPIVVVVGHGAEAVAAAATAAVGADAGRLRFAEQRQQLGTGHAVGCALPQLGDISGLATILSGDVPLVDAGVLTALQAAAARAPAGLALATFRPADPTGYGRILRDDTGRVIGIREHRDADPRERAITECNAGIYCVDLDGLRRELPEVGRANAQGEIYLTDVVERFAGRGAVETVEVAAHVVAGINTPEELAALEDTARALGLVP